MPDGAELLISIGQLRDSKLAHGAQRSIELFYLVPVYAAAHRF